ncbi:MAG: chemotaxis response regulator protein-glutamate methylesterase [Gammaproteobacteria bacterium]|nr:chemotaxis response regulator protein-glutamate methylesterase [Gammaproteobacteria bacterium]MDH5728434.1 chemotaxis response regulator protein-glutamate methylesterase [Gammaproteobacteria bacterium]
MSKIKVMIVDDSAVVRNVLSDVLKGVSGIEVIGSAADPLFAMRKMEEIWPDVIVLDIEMPRMDGITFLKKIMNEHPTPVIICSTLTESGAETTMSAMSAGAVDIITKPKIGLKNFLQEQKPLIVESIRGAAQAQLSRRKTKPLTKVEAPPKLTADAVLAPPSKGAMTKTTESVIAIGTSTGGTQALELVLSALPRVSPGIVVVQHMPEKFTKAFADRLNGICEIEVKEAQNNDRVMPGRALIAPGGLHMMLKRSGAQYIVEISDGPVVSRHKPSVDVLFRSVAKYAGANALGIIMTGMGDDGAAGLLEMHEAGAMTIAQDEASCIVFGMPKEAIKKGAVDKVLSLNEIPQKIVSRNDS